MREVPNLPKFAGGLAPFRGWPSFQEESLDGVAFFSDSTTVAPPQLLEGHATQVTELKTKVSSPLQKPINSKKIADVICT